MSQRSEIVALIPDSAKKILDIGCASGEVGSAIKKKLECEVVGIEIDNKKAQAAASKINKVIVGDAEKIDSSLNASLHLL